MKKIFFLYITMAFGCAVYAQNPTAIEIGTTSASTIVNDSLRINISIGGLVGASSHVNIKDASSVNVGDAIIGMPLNISYFPAVFGSDLFASKGYYPDYVQLSWDIISQADNIKRFKIFRKPLLSSGVDSTLVTTVNGAESNYRDEFVQFGVIYKYTIYAEGIADGLLLPYVNVVEGIGFALPEGTVSGRVTFEGGTAVSDVNVIAETEGELQGKSLYLNGTNANMVIPHRSGHNELNLETSFSLQMWVKSIASGTKQLFSKGADYQLTYDQSNLVFTVGDATLTMPFTNPVDSFFQVTATFDPGDSLNLYATVSSDTIYSMKIAAGLTPATNSENIVFGGTQTSNYFNGNIDEIRLWSKLLNLQDIKNDAYRYVTANQTNLAGYWRLQAGVGNGFYDGTQTLGVFNENHGKLYNASWSNITPLRSQLAHKGSTDSNGNYIIEGIPYESSGSTYRFVPILGVHEFDPTERLRVIGPGSVVHNGVDFKDVSAFAVTGVVRYFNSTFPVEGVSILIDGKPSLTSDGTLITTDVNGQFNVDVPIGNHTLKMSKTSHTFVEDGSFNYDFLNPLNGLEFVDSTLVRVVGRVVGGPVEEAYPVGFGKSTNNIGNGTIVFESESTKGNLVILTGATVTLGNGETFIDPANSRDTTIVEKHFTTTNSYKLKQLTVSADVNSGDFIALLPPEKYNVISVTAQGSDNPSGAGDVLDLRNIIEQTEAVKDTVRKQVDGADVLGTFNAAEYNAYTLEESITGDTTYTVAIDTFRYHKLQNFILRLTPSITVKDKERSDGLFGNDAFYYVDENLPENNDTIPLIEAGAYTFGQPIFTQRKKYDFEIELFEEYTNQATGVTTQVPVVDGEIRITNELAISSDEVSLSFNNRGKTIYSFTVGLPNRNLDAGTPANSFSNVLNITALSGNKGAIQTAWIPGGNTFRGIVFGGEPIGNNFVTSGPTEVITILRDPPGSKSYASLTKGQTVTKSTSVSSSDTFSNQSNFDLQLGASIKIFTGIGVGTITEVEIKSSTDIGFSAEEVVTDEFESSTTYTTTQTWSTSKDPDFVGSEGDVFVGHATNLVYGKSLFLEPILAADCGTPCSDSNVNGFKLGVKEGLRINPEFATGFIYTQSHIENTLIPNLEDLRNSFLIYADTASVNPTTDPVYVSLVSPDDPRFGSNNHDKSVWGTAAISNHDQWGSGPSYVIKLPPNYGSVSDTLFYYNREIKEWEYWLAENEKQKVESNLLENISFDGGVTYENSVESTTSSTAIHTFEFMVSNSTGLSFGASVDNFGYSQTLSFSSSTNTNSSQSTTSANTTNYSYFLNDGDEGDSYTVDVKEANDGFGPIFSVKGGVSSCPYQAQELTTYFEPGNHVLHEATLNVEDPVLSFDNNIVSDVPDNREAEFKLILQNNSQSEQDALFDLKMDNSTNPDGAVISIDGAPIGNGRTFTVKFGVSLSLTMKVGIGKSDVFDYENIRLVLESRCESDTFKDDATFSVHFQPSCTDIAISSPTNNWVINSNTNPANILPITIGSYDPNVSSFNNVKFQYRGLGSALWLTDHIFYANETDYNTAVTNGQESISEWINSRSEIIYNWDMSTLPDREYEIRALAVCVLGPGNEIITPTDALLGIKDTKRPQLFGSPQPASGILSIDDEISIQFDEPIVAANLTPFNFSVKGVLNGRELTNGTSVDLDGVNDYVRINNASNLNSSFTIEFWLQRDALATEGVVISKGTSPDNRFQVGFDASDNMKVEFSGQVITSAALKANDTNWHHYAVTYNADDKEVTAFQDGEFIMDRAPITGNYEGDGAIYLGKSASGTGSNFDGAIHEFRVWNIYQQQGQIASYRFISLKGSEVNLTGYWPFDEGRGELSIDLARSKQAELLAGWRIQPIGYAATFNGSTDYLEINTSSTVIIQDIKDFTVEFWFKGATGQGAATLFSSGKGDGSDDSNFTDPLKALSIGFDDSGDLYASSNGQFLTVVDGATDYLDDNWHHLALILKRKGNISFIVDGELLANKSANNFGGISGTQMWIGTRGTKISTLTASFDRYFNGIIDEFRIWEMAKNIDQINLDRNKHKKGDELGLVAYYPFESYREDFGVLVLDKTLEDQLINIQPNGSNLTGGAATVAGSVTLGTETANIGLPRPVSEVDFTWVVNGDKIIITPNPTQADLIENVILDITVANVEDNRGNILASPATWTAYVDRNSMQWGEKSLDFTKEFLEPLSFNVDIINRGGTYQSFSLSNIPPWISVSQSSGSIEPASSLTLTFEVAEELNIGEFTQDIRLSTDFGFDEIFLINIKVMQDSPSDWIVDPSQFEHSMSLIGQISVEGFISNDPEDILAVFVNDTIRGLSNLEYVPSYDNYQNFVSVYSNIASGEALEFRIWDASTGTIRGNITPDDLTFSSNSTLGQPFSPILFEATNSIYQGLTVAQGWQWVSFNLNSSDLNSSNTLLDGLQATEGDQIKGMSGIDDYTEENDWAGSLGTILPDEMYKIYLKNGGTISYKGDIIEPTTKNISITSGWNWLGFIPRVNMDINEALGSLTSSTRGDIIKDQDEFAIYETGIGWIGSLKSLKSGEGYMLKATNPGTLTYPNESLINGRNGRNGSDDYETVPLVVKQWPYNPSLYANNMTIIASLKSSFEIPDESNYILGAFINNEVRGITKGVFDDKSNSYKYYLNIGGDMNGDSISFKIIDSNGSISSINEKINYYVNSLIGTYNEPMKLSFENQLISVNQSKIVAYPNPFNNSIDIRGNIDRDGTLKINIYNLSGKIVRSLFKDNVKAGTWNISWDGNDIYGSKLHSGIYIISINTKTEAYKIKVIKN